jgi:hypothetical protein
MSILLPSIGSPRPHLCTQHLISIIGKITGYVYIGDNFTVREKREKFPLSLGGPGAKGHVFAPMAIAAITE